MSLLPSSPRYTCLRYCLMALTFITITSVTYGQSVHGIVSSNSKSLSGATVKNLNSHSVMISDAGGWFEMAPKKGDTIVVSYTGFKTDTIVYKTQSMLLVSLKPAPPDLLKEVTIKEHQLSPEDKLKKNQADYKQIYRIGDDKNWLMLGFGFVMDIDKLYSRFSKAGRNARKLQKTFVRDYNDDIIDTRFTRTLVAQYTHYEGQQLDSFMIDNRPSYDFIKHASDYDIIEYIIKAKKNAAPGDAGVITQNDKQGSMVK